MKTILIIALLLAAISLWLHRHAATRTVGPEALEVFMPVTGRLGRCIPDSTNDAGPGINRVLNEVARKGYAGIDGRGRTFTVCESIVVPATGPGITIQNFRLIQSIAATNDMFLLP